MGRTRQFERERDGGATGGAGEATARTWSRRGVLAAGGAAVGTALAGCTGSGSGGTATGTDMPSVTYRNQFKITGPVAAANVAAIEEGIWEDEGIDVSFETSSGGRAAAQSVASGNDTFGNGGVNAPLALREQGESLVVLGQVFNPMGGIVTPGDRGISDWGDLEGKTVGRYPFGATATTGEAAMRRRGVDVSTVEFRNVQPGSGERLMMSGEIDAMIKWFALSREKLRSEGYSPNVLVMSQVLDHLGVAVYTRQSVVENDPDLVNRFLRGWLRGQQYLVNNPEAVLDVLDRETPYSIDRENQRAALPVFVAGLAPTPSLGREYGKGWVSPVTMDETISLFADVGLVEGSVAAEDAYTNEFVEANRDLAVETAEELYTYLDGTDVGPNYV